MLALNPAVSAGHFHPIFAGGAISPLTAGGLPVLEPAGGLLGAFWPAAQPAFCRLPALAAVEPFRATYLADRLRAKAKGGANSPLAIRSIARLMSARCRYRTEPDPAPNLRRSRL